MRESTLVSIHETGMGVYGRAPSLCHTVDLIFSRCLVDWLNWDFHSLEFSIVHGIYMDNVPYIHPLAAAVQVQDRNPGAKVYCACKMIVKRGKNVWNNVYHRHFK